MDKGEHWGVLQQAHDWIRFADAKAGAVLAASGVLGGTVLAALPKPGPYAKHGLTFWLLTVVLALLVMSTCLALLCLSPVLRRKSAPSSLIFFDHIARKYKENKSGFVEKFMGATQSDDLDDDVVEQIWASSLVASRKFKFVNASVKLFFVALILCGLAMFIDKV